MKKNKMIFWCIAAIIYLMLAIFFVTDGSIFIGCLWGALSVLYIIKIFCIFRKERSEEKQNNM